MVISSVGEGVWPCVLFYLFPHKSSRSAHRLATGRENFLLLEGFVVPPGERREGRLGSDAEHLARQSPKNVAQACGAASLAAGDDPRGQGGHRETAGGCK